MITDINEYRRLKKKAEREAYRKANPFLKRHRHALWISLAAGIVMINIMVLPKVVNNMAALLMVVSSGILIVSLVLISGLLYDFNNEEKDSHKNDQKKS